MPHGAFVRRRPATRANAPAFLPTPPATVALLEPARPAAVAQDSTNRQEPAIASPGAQLAESSIPAAVQAHSGAPEFRRRRATPFAFHRSVKPEAAVPQRSRSQKR